MTLQTFKQKFYTTLESHYPKTELDSFYQLLLENVLKTSRVHAALHPQQVITEAQCSINNKILKGLLAHQPIQHLIGFVNFMDLKLNVNSNVLIPRPETEELIQWIVADQKTKKTTTILDIGTGTGCIPIALYTQLQNTKITSIDVSKEALQTAKENAQQNKAKINFVHQNILTTSKLNGLYDVIVSNPPYVRELEKKEIQKNVLDYEPHLALFVANNDPLIFYKKIAQLALTALTPQGALYFEINQYLGEETKNLLKNLGYTQTTLQKDIFGNHRMIKASL